VFRLDVALVRLALRGRVVWTVHNLAAHESRDPGGDLAARRYLARRAARLIAHCGAARAAVGASYRVAEERVEVIPFGTFAGSYPNRAARDESRRRLGVDGDRFVFLFLGSLRPYKGIEELLESFALVPEPRKQLLVAGHASDEGYLEEVRRRAAASPGVRLEARFIADDELQFFFNAADAVVLPFREVLTSASLVLAMGFGRMVVAPRLGCIPEYADPAGSVLYDPARPGALAEALAGALARDAEACGRHNLERARRLDWNETGARTARIYATLS
jgi:beta-1,4-mannosyltransferase